MKLFAFSGGRKPKDNTLPSMTEIVPQLSVEEIFRDYCRGVLHPSRPGIYDPDAVTDENFEEVEDIEDIADLEIGNETKPVAAPAPKEPESKAPDQPDIEEPASE